MINLTPEKTFAIIDMETIVYHAIGIIHTPYKEIKNMPIQGRYNQFVDGRCELFKPYGKGLTNLDHFSHAILLYHFNRSETSDVITKPFLENEEHGIFAIRSPHRPNKIGISIVKILKIEENTLYFTEVDMLDGTPLIDIKPYVKHFDERQDVKSGWVDKHFQNNHLPEKLQIKEL